MPLFVAMAMGVSMMLVPLIGRAVSFSESDVKAWWTFDETSGVRYDSTVNNNDLTDNNTVGYATGKKGNGADLETASFEYFSIANASQTGMTLSSYTDLSICFWAQYESVVGQWWTFYDEFSSNSGIQFITHGTLDKYALYLGKGSDYPNYNFDTTGFTISSGQWYYFCTIFDSAQSKVRIIVNNTYDTGYVSATYSTFASTLTDAGVTFYIGGNGATTYFDGILDEFFIADTVLTNDDLTALYNSGNGVTYTDLFTPTSTTSTTTATTTSSVDVEELKWVLELYLAIFMFLLFTWLGYRFTKVFI